MVSVSVQNTEQRHSFSQMQKKNPNAKKPPNHPKLDMWLVWMEKDKLRGESREQVFSSKATQSIDFP